MAKQTLPPAPRPCISCPYRRDVPSGIWDTSEYEKLAAYDGETFAQPPNVFLCHQQDGRLCAGWCAVHDMDESLGLRLLSYRGGIGQFHLDEVLDYTTDVPLFDSGAEAAAHGLRDVNSPAGGAIKMIDRLERKRGTKKRGTK